MLFKRYLKSNVLHVDQIHFYIYTSQQKTTSRIYYQDCEKHKISVSKRLTCGMYSYNIKK